MMNGFESKIECPFYKSHRVNSIFCESPIPNTESRFVFKSMKAATKHIENVCSVNQGKKCLHYRAMMILYERGMLDGSA